MQQLSVDATRAIPEKRTSTKNIIVVIVGILYTIGCAFYVNHGTDWSGGAGKTPRDMMIDYYELAYGQGKGGAASAEYWAPDAEDLVPDAIDRKDGYAVAHEIHNMVVDGRQVSVHHTIGASATTPAIEAVDIYTILRGKIVKRERVAQIIEPQNQTEAAE
ncbi:MAG: hypothetical protein RBS88_06085 [Spongiibacteraceae bacterium]|jgi:hypothetical protein|nr:hypothetical protein [Spongiibacteraceae bacterium]